MERTSLADLHVHTCYSDGTANVPQVLAEVAQSPLQVVAITDHDVIDGALEARSLARDFGVEVIVGEEVSSAEGHVLALFIEEWIPPNRSAAETIAAIHAQGGLCVAPHPYDFAVVSLGRSGLHRRYGREWDVDAIEVFNASLTWPRHHCNRVAQRVAQELGVPAVGGSDSHSLATIGSGYTVFPGTTANDLYRALQTGQVNWGGDLWTAKQYLEVCWLSMQQRSVWGALKLVCAELPFLHRPPTQTAKNPNPESTLSSLPAQKQLHT